MSTSNLGPDRLRFRTRGLVISYSGRRTEVGLGCMFSRVSKIHEKLLRTIPKQKDPNYFNDSDESYEWRYGDGSQDENMKETVVVEVSFNKEKRGTREPN